MEITSASQQFAVAEQKTVAYGRKQQLLSNEPRRDSAPATAPAPAEDAAPDLTADDGQLFNAYQTVGMVKRILAQLSQHTSNWLQEPETRPSGVETAAAAQLQATFTSQTVWLGVAQPAADSSPTGQRLAITEWEWGYQAVQASFSGELQLQDGSSIGFAFDFSMAVSWARFSYTEQPLQDPLVVSLSGNPVALNGNSTEFDLLSNGSKVKLPQLAAQQYYLAYDRNQDRQVNNGSELFGPRTGQGFAELAEFDDNGNGFIDPGDDIWQYLYLWRPEHSLLSMQQAQLGAFSVSSAATPMPLLDQAQQKTGEIQRSGLAFTDNARPVLVQQIDIVV